MKENKSELKISDIGEFALIERINKIVDKAFNPESIVCGIGDDTAVLSLPESGYEMLVTCDSMVEGHHYLRQYISPVEIGRRAMVMNISDIGAMGGIPLYALITLGLNPSESVDDIEEIYKGFIIELEPFGAAIIGGNISKINGSSFIDITLIGKVAKDCKVFRSGAMPGDAVMVTGCPGKSVAGYHIVSKGIRKLEQHKALLDAYIRPHHRAKEGHALAMSGKITSMIDLSDGLSGDLFHICEKSNVGVEIKEDMLPSCEAFDQVSSFFKKREIDFILGPSDDYELLFTCRPKDIEYIMRLLNKFDCPVTHIGRIVSPEHGISLIGTDGGKRPLLKRGWDHFAK